jgi:hypothetical protein
MHEYQIRAIETVRLSKDASKIKFYKRDTFFNNILFNRIDMFILTTNFK